MDQLDKWAEFAVSVSNYLDDRFYSIGGIMLAFTFVWIYGRACYWRGVAASDEKHEQDVRDAEYYRGRVKELKKTAAVDGWQDEALFWRAIFKSRISRPAPAAEPGDADEVEGT
jgi:hypothetical protein